MNELGSEAENIAAIYLQQKGLKLVARNYQSRYGEIDLIMQDGKTLVFIEVRMRSNNNFGGAAMSITPSKQQKIIRTAEHFLQTYGNASCRFDVILMNKASNDSIEWLSNAFDAS